MCRKYLFALYLAFVARTNIKAAFIENWVSLQGVHPLSGDDECDERQSYGALFSEECRHEIEELYLMAIRQMRGVPYTESNDVLNGLSFLQEIISTAMWKYQRSVGEMLETFTREFDRLDVQVERERLHTCAQEM